jgi:hypothetical protein
MKHVFLTLLIPFILSGCFSAGMTGDRQPMIPSTSIIRWMPLKSLIPARSRFFA